MNRYHFVASISIFGLGLSMPVLGADMTKPARESPAAPSGQPDTTMGQGQTGQTDAPLQKDATQSDTSKPKINQLPAPGAFTHDPANAAKDNANKPQDGQANSQNNTSSQQMDPVQSDAFKLAPSTSAPVESNIKYSIIPFTTHGYVGASLGESKYDINCASGFSCDRNGTGFKIFTGGRVRDILGLEVSVLEMGKAVRAGGNTWARGLNLSVIGNLPIGDRFSVFGRLGGTYGWTKTESNTSSLQSGKDRGVGLAYGLGINFKMSTNWGLRGEWERHRFEFVNAKDDVDLYTIGFNYKF